MSEKADAMRVIADWVSNYGWKVSYNQKNSDDYPVFHSNGNKKPDLLLQKGNYSILIEVKVGDKHKDMLDGIEKLFEYIGEYYTGRTVYTDENDNKLKISAFLLGSSFSPYGYISHHDAKLNEIDYSGYLNQERNMNEKPITHTITRILWRLWGSGPIIKFYENMRIGPLSEGFEIPARKPNIGVLVAKINHSPRSITKEPWAYMDPNNFVDLSYRDNYVFNKI